MLRVHCAVPEMRPEYCDRLVQHLHRVSAVIASGKRPVPFRTRKLSPTAPMVLRGGPRGRVGRRRTTLLKETATRFTGWPSSHFPIQFEPQEFSMTDEQPPRDRQGDERRRDAERSSRAGGGSGR